MCDIVNSLELSQSVVSRHLAYLRNSGLVNTRREGVWIYYQLIENCSFVDELLQQFRKAGANSISLKYDLERLEAEANERNCC